MAVSEELGPFYDIYYNLREEILLIVLNKLERRWTNIKVWVKVMTQLNFITLKK